jgi:hypothetical protein
MTPREPRREWPPRRDDFEDDLDLELRDKERRELLTLAQRLTEQRPVPRPGLRSAIRSRLLGGTSAAAPLRVRRLIFGYASSGALLLLVAGAGLVGLGPFAA